MSIMVCCVESESIISACQKQQQYMHSNALKYTSYAKYNMSICNLHSLKIMQCLLINLGVGTTLS